MIIVLLWCCLARALVWARFNRDRDWGYLGPPDASKLDDIVNFEPCVYAIDRSGRLYVVHYDSIWPKGRKHYQTLRVNCVVNDPICSGCDGEKRKATGGRFIWGFLFSAENCLLW